VVDVAVADVFEGQTSGGSDELRLLHETPQLRLRLLAGESFTRAGLADPPDLPLDLAVADPPLAVPGAARLEE